MVKYKTVSIYFLLSELYLTKVKALEKDKDMLMAELAKMKTKYNDINQQLDQMYKLMQEKKVSLD